uniref:Secreted protein n=1 Tax=Ditylenchus dipsaci TaxID=166011 RepID=A0A915E4M1_9BILA
MRKYIFSLLAIILSLLLLADSTASLVIYRRKPKPKLICHEELMSSIDGELGMVTSGGGVAEFDVPMPSPEAEHHHKKHSTKGDQRQKRGAAQVTYNTSNANDNDSINSSSFSAEVVEETEPVISLGNSDVDSQFEIVGDSLTEEEKKSIRDKLTKTCRALNLT